jgi:hypothetical protein
MRVEEGGYRACRSGGWLHYVADAVPPVTKNTSAPLPAKAGADTLHAVYHLLLRALDLTDTHRNDLRRRGLSDEEIDRRNYASLQITGRNRIAAVLYDGYGQRLFGVPGFVFQGGRPTIAGAAGLLIPSRDMEGRIIAVVVRSDNVNACKYSYLSSSNHGSPSSGSPVHVPVGSLEGPPARVVLVEGILKSDVFHALTGMYTIGIAGALNWRSALPLLKSLGKPHVVLAYDRDAQENPAVASARSSCRAALIKEGFSVSYLTWRRT